MTALVVEPRFYDEDLLSTWSKRDLSMLTNSGASEYLRRVLSEKARGRRKGRASSRFFGEAFVAAHEPHQRGYYSSFKWLTNRKFTDRNASFPKDGSRTDKEEFREALLECFDGGQLRALQARAEILYRATGERPVPPDLWLIDKSGHHRFIEVKLPSDWVKPRQWAGLAAIACSLRAEAGVSVEVLELSPKEKLFDRFCRTLRRKG